MQDQSDDDDDGDDDKSEFSDPSIGTGIVDFIQMSCISIHYGPC